MIRVENNPGDESKPRPLKREIDLIEPTNRHKPVDLTQCHLIAQAQQGDHQAFKALYDLYVARTYALCLRSVADPTEAELITQDVFVRVWQKLGTYKQRGAFGGWLRRVTINTIIENRRSNARRLKRIDPLIDVNNHQSPSNNPRYRNLTQNQAMVVQPAQIEAALDLERVISQLPAGARLAFVLHDIEGYRQKEIAAIAGIAIGTVKAQLHRARRLLRNKLGDSQGVIQNGIT